MFSKLLKSSVSVVACVLGLGSLPVLADVQIIGYHGIFADNYQKAVIEPFTEKTGIKVVYNPIQLSARNLGQIRAEKDNPTMDLSIMDAMVARTGNAEGLFEEIDVGQVPNAGALYEDAYVNKGFGPAITFDHAVMLYNTEAVNPPPEGLMDLFRPEFDGKIAMYGAPEIAALMNMILLTRSLGGDETKSVEPGIEKLAELAPSVQTWQPTPDQYTLVANGTALVATGWNARAQFYSDDTQGKLGVVIPAEGSMFQINTINLVKNAPNREEAIKFIDYALSPEAQTAFTNLMFYAPTNPAATPSEEALARTAASDANRAKMQPLDWDFFVANREGWLQEWRRRILSAR